MASEGDGRPCVYIGYVHTAYRRKIRSYFLTIESNPLKSGNNGPEEELQSREYNTRQ